MSKQIPNAQPRLRVPSARQPPAARSGARQSSGAHWTQAVARSSAFPCPSFLTSLGRTVILYGRCGCEVSAACERQAARQWYVPATRRARGYARSLRAHCSADRPKCTPDARECALRRARRPRDESQQARNKAHCETNRNARGGTDLGVAIGRAGSRQKEDRRGSQLLAAPEVSW